MEEKVIEKPKKRINVLAISTIILLLLVLGMGIYIGYTETKMNKDEKKEVIDVEEDEEKIEYLDIYSDQIQNLYEKIHTGRNCISDTATLYKKGTVSIDNFKNIAFYMAHELILDERGIAQEGYWKRVDSFTYDEINKKAKNIFGSSYNLEDKEYTICSYKYDKATKTYNYDPEGGCGCTTGPEEPQITLYKATKNDNEINIYNAVIYKKYNEGSVYFTYYKDPLYNQKINDNACFDGYSTKECIDNSTKYKFTFTKEKDNYVLTNITKAD
ncbi:MAG: hypothetical protein J6A17_00945 [Bacilli bacterium]|nr:hypothetical protein [Bacilli bacterium]